MVLVTIVDNGSCVVGLDVIDVMVIVVDVICGMPLRLILPLSLIAVVVMGIGA